MVVDREKDVGVCECTVAVKAVFREDYLWSGLVPSWPEDSMLLPFNHLVSNTVARTLEERDSSSSSFHLLEMPLSVSRAFWTPCFLTTRDSSSPTQSQSHSRSATAATRHPNYWRYFGVCTRVQKAPRSCCC